MEVDCRMDKLVSDLMTDYDLHSWKLSVARMIQGAEINSYVSGSPKSMKY